MKVYTNQKLIFFHTDFRRWSNPKQMYFELGYDDLSIAIKTLSHCGLKLFLYLAKNLDIEIAKDKKISSGGMFPLSPVDVEQYTGIKRKKNGKASETYTKAVKELIDNGYLRHNGNGNYTFSIVPDPAEDSPVNEGVPVADLVTDPAEDSPINEGVHVADPVAVPAEVFPWETDPAEDSPVNEGVPVADPAIESAIYKAIDTVWRDVYRYPPEESPHKIGYHFVFDDEVENVLKQNGIEITEKVKYTIKHNSKIWERVYDTTPPF